MPAPITPPTLFAAIDAASSTLTVSYTPGSGSIQVASAASFGSPTPSSPIRVTVLRLVDNVRVHFKVTAITGNTLTVSVNDGYQDLALNVGDKVGCVISAPYITDLNSAVSTTISTVNQLVTTGGPQGPQGAQGGNGPQGSNGPQGGNGPQGYQGGTGSSGPQGPQGIPGNPGLNGVGSQGPQGYQGIAGTLGPQGYQGSQGPQGYQGLQGYQGSTGVGSQGPQGPQGSGGSGSGSPGGSSGQLQYNNNGAFAGSAATINSNTGGITAPKFYVNATYDTIGGYRTCSFSAAPTDQYSHCFIAQGLSGQASFTRAFGVVDANENIIAGLNFAGVYYGDGSGLLNIGGAGNNSTNLGPTGSIVGNGWTASYVIGAEVCDLVTSGGQYLIGIGYNIWRQNGASNNIAIGKTVGAFSATNVGSNVAVGNSTLSLMTSGGNNVALGHNAGGGSSNLTNGVFLGQGATATNATLTNCTALGYGAVVGASNTMVLGGTGGNLQAVVIGDTSGYGAQLNVNVPTTSTKGIVVRASSGQTADLQANQNASGTVLSGVDANGCYRTAITSGAPTSTPAVGSTMVDPATCKLWIYCTGGWKSMTLS